MSAYAVTALMFVSRLGLLGPGRPSVDCLGSVGTLAAALLWGDGALDIVYFSTLELMNNMVLSAVPLFIFMGFVLHESRSPKTSSTRFTSGPDGCAARWAAARG